MKPNANPIHVIIAALIALFILLAFIQEVGAKGVKTTQYTATVVAHDSVFADVVFDQQVTFAFEYGTPYGWTVDPERQNLITLYLDGDNGTWEAGFNPTRHAGVRPLLRFDVENHIDVFPPVGEQVQVSYDSTTNTLLIR